MGHALLDGIGGVNLEILADKVYGNLLKEMYFNGTQNKDYSYILILVVDEIL